MKLTIESTDRVVMLGGVPARVFSGRTAGGLQLECLVTRILPEPPKPRPETIEMQPAGRDAYAPA